MPIDASRNPYDAPRFDSGGDKAVRPDEVAKEELDDELDGALDDLGAVKGAVTADDLAGTDDAAGDDLDLAGTGVKGTFAIDDELADADVKGVVGADAGDDLDLAGTGAKGAFEVDVELDDADPGLKGLDGVPDDLDDLDEPDAFDSFKGDDALDELSGVKGGAFDVDVDGGGDAFAADLGEVPDLDDKVDLVDDDHELLDQKGSIIDAIGDAMKDSIDEF